MTTTSATESTIGDGGGVVVDKTADADGSLRNRLAAIGSKLPRGVDRAVILMRQKSKSSDGDAPTELASDGASRSELSPFDPKRPFADAACVITMNHVKANEQVIPTAIAISVIDVARGDIIYGRAWKVKQCLPPSSAASSAKMNQQDMLSLVLIHEKMFGYFFVDRSDAAVKLSDIADEIVPIAIACESGCYSPEVVDVKRVFPVLAYVLRPLPLPDTRDVDGDKKKKKRTTATTVVKTADIVKDVYTFAKCVVAYGSRRVVAQAK